ncbi:MAG: bifunctional diaminohydroxyphosphoribosylaminopyrimidine deaminase/5-amino-6-(5-phosphoribosylamino)uracil reductase RibD [Caulobacterales bacterium]
MQRAIALARGVLGSTWPNPAVGCVVAKDGVVIAEAATRPGGRPHAEEQALAAAGAAARGATAYVTLEPCAARSNGSASCSERLAAAGVVRVVFACDNPHDLTAGGGLDRLRAAGVTVDSGLLADEAAALYRGFLHHVRTGLPLVEAARTPDGYDGLFEPASDEPLSQALQRFGAAGYRLLWTPAGGPVAGALAAEGRLAH